MVVVDGSMERWSDCDTMGASDGIGFLASDVASVLVQNSKPPGDTSKFPINVRALLCQRQVG